MDEEVIILIEGDLVEIMQEIYSITYREYLYVGKNGKKILYVRLQKEIYGCLRSNFLFCPKLKSELEDFGFLLKPYDACVANKWVNGSQITITWHVDDLKISHKDAGEVTKMTTYLEYIYGPMTEKRGKKNIYLVMGMECTERRAFKISMTRYIDEAFDEFSKDVTTLVVSPAEESLLKTNKSGKYLIEERAILFHRRVAKLLFVSKRARSDIHPTISFLTTRVLDLDEDDRKNLQHMLQYPHGACKMALHLNSDDLNIIHWRVDTSYVSHDDLNGPTDATVSIGR